MMEMLFFLFPLIKPNKLSISLGLQGFCAFPSAISAKGAATHSLRQHCLLRLRVYMRPTRVYKGVLGGNVKQQLTFIFGVRRKVPTQFSTRVGKLF